MVTITRKRAAVANEAMGFFTDTTVCIGCKACEVACKNWNQLPATHGGVSEMSGDSYDNTRKLDGTHWRHVKFIEQFDGPYNGRWLMMSDVCKHCVKAGCIEVCPTGAIIRTEFDTVVIQSDVCNGCRACIAGCPFGVIDMNMISGTAQQLKAQGEARARLYGDDPNGLLGGLNAFYLLVDNPEVYGLPANPQLPSSRLKKSGAFSVATAAVLGVLALVGIRKRRMDEKEGVMHV